MFEGAFRDEPKIREALARVLGSDTFSRSARSRELLKHLVETTLRGEARSLKAISIAMDVFGRADSFDSLNDTLVRVQAGRLRLLLLQYYQTEGETDPIRIELPKGGYAPIFVAGAAPAEALVSEADRRADNPPGAHEAHPLPDSGQLPATGQPPDSGQAFNPARLRRAAFFVVIALGLAGFIYGLSAVRTGQRSETADVQWPPEIVTIAIPHFEAPEGEGQWKERLGPLEIQVTAALSKSPFLSIVSNPSQLSDAEPASSSAKPPPHYVLANRAFQSGDFATVNLSLIENANGKHIWTQSYRISKSAAGKNTERLANEIASDIRLALIKSVLRSPPAALAPGQLFLLATWVPGKEKNTLSWEQERVIYARRAIEIDPNFGPAHSVLADKISYLANVDPPSDTPQAHELAEFHAQRAIETASDDADAMFNISIHYWHAGDLKRSLLFTKRTLELSPHHLMANFLINAIPYTCATTPQKVIDTLIAYDSQLTTSNPIRWVSLTWISTLYLHNGEFEKATEFGRRSDAIFRTPDTFYRLAVALQQSGDTKSALQLIDQQRQNWPNLDPQHYADVTMARRCNDSPRNTYVLGLYRDLAKLVKSRTEQ